MANETPSDRVRARVKSLRRAEEGLTVAKLAERCKELGMPELTAQALHRIEQGATSARKARPITVDEVFILARALDVTVGHLLFGELSGIGPMTPKGLRQLAEAMEQSGITWGDDGLR